MNNIFGIDLGTNSIGWALRNSNLLENQIEKFGVITFNKGVGLGKTGEYSYAAERTKKRSTRRLYQSRKYRLWATLEHLIREDYCPLTMENLNKWRHYCKEEALKNKNAGRVYPVDDLLFDAWIKLDFNGDGKPDYTSPYQLRKELAETKLDFTKEENRFKLGRALYHIAQRRGFKSSRKGSDDEKKQDDHEIVDLQHSEKRKNKEIITLFEKYPEAKTIGMLFAFLENNQVRIRESIAQYAIRENYKDEIKYIFERQNIATSSALYSKLIETGHNKNDGSIFYKRPLRSQKGLIGKCTLEPNKYRAPISHPRFETFRAWCFLNNLKYKPKIEAVKYKDNPNDGMKIETTLLEDIFNKLFFRKKAYFPLSEITDYLKKQGKNWTLNYPEKTTVTGCPVSARLKEIFGVDYLDIKIPKIASPKKGKTHYDIEDIWHVLFTYEDQEFVAAFAEEKLNLSHENVKQFSIAWNALPVGYGMLSINAINKINKFLQKGLIYTEAVLLAKIPEIIGDETWKNNEQLFLDTIGLLIEDNRKQKNILTIVNNLVAQHKNSEQKFGYKDSTYQLDDADLNEIELSAKDVFGTIKWNGKSNDERVKIISIAKDCYQSYFITTGLIRKDINNERFFIVHSNNNQYYKGDSGFYKMPKLKDTISDFITNHFEVTEKEIQKIYHPSEINIYPPAKEDKDGVLKLGSPKTGSFKNPMAMRALHELRKLMNYLIETGKIDNETRIVVEVARELNDANKRWAIEAHQKQRELENQEFEEAIRHLYSDQNRTIDSIINDEEIDKMRLWYEQNDEETIPPVLENEKEDGKKTKKKNPKEIDGIRWSENKKDSFKKIAAQKLMVDKYRLWKEQECQCMYTGKIIRLSDLFDDNTIDFEHTIPRSISLDNSLANQTVCFADFNRNIKKKQIPSQLNNYSNDTVGYTAILPRLAKWQDKVERIKQQIDFWKFKSSKAVDKTWKDDAIKQRHLWQMELDYWKNKVDRFTMKEVTSGFKNSQLVDTQLISKYAFHYLKTYFDKVDVQKGSNTAEFRKIFSLQEKDEKKDRSKHSHHAKDATVLTLIPIGAKKEEILKEYYVQKEKGNKYTREAYKGFKREYIWEIDDEVLINNVFKDQTLSPAKRKIRKRGKEQFIEGTNKPKIATGDCIRGQLHQETFYGAIKPAKRGENGNIEKNEKGEMILEDKIKYVLRVPFQFKSKADSPGFKTLEEIEKQVVDEGLKEQIRLQVKKAGSLKEAFEQGIYMLDKSGNKVNKIRHIRCWASVSEPLKIKKQTNLSSKEYKQHYYAGNATNSYFAIYEKDGKKDFDFSNLMDTAQILSAQNLIDEKKLFEPFITLTKGRITFELPLKYTLKKGLKIIFAKDDEDIKSLPNKLISNRLYIFTNFEKDGRLNFQFHLEARNKIEESYSESEIDFENPKPTLRFSYAKYNLFVENYDFEMKIDGEIKWK